MLGIKQYRYHVTNQSLYQLTGQVPLRETIRERQLKFTGHCNRIPEDKPAKRFSIHESSIKSSLRPEHQGRHILNKFRPAFYNWRQISRSRSDKKDGSEQI